MAAFFFVKKVLYILRYKHICPLQRTNICVALTRLGAMISV